MKPVSAKGIWKKSDLKYRKDLDSKRVSYFRRQAARAGRNSKETVGKDNIRRKKDDIE